jgi:DHA1 family inner membrane transport protein
MTTTSIHQPIDKMPKSVWLITLAAFAIGTAEFVVVGLLIQMAHALNVSEGTAGLILTAYALAIVVGGPPLMILLSKFNKKKVLLFLLVIFVIGNFVSALTTSFYILLISRVITGLCQGPFHGLGSIVASKLAPPSLSGRAVGMLFAGLSLANVLGVPIGTWIGNSFGWNIPFYVIAFMGILSFILLWFYLPNVKESQALETVTIKSQLSAFKDFQLLASFAFTILAWTGFMTFYGYYAPVAQHVTHLNANQAALVLIILGSGFVVGNIAGGRLSDKNLSLSLIIWPLAMILSLFLVGMASSYTILFALACFLFGVCSFANITPMQMRVIKYGQKAQEMAATVNISAFNLANTLGTIIGAHVVDSKSMGPAYVPFTAGAFSIIGLVLIVFLEYKQLRLRPKSR